MPGAESDRIFHIFGNLGFTPTSVIYLHKSKGQLQPPVGHDTFFHYRGQLGSCVGHVTFFHHSGQLGPEVVQCTMYNVHVTFSRLIGQLRPCIGHVLMVSLGPP